MEVYILDSLYRRTAVVDRFTSLIWTERWADIGDFKLVLPSTAVNRSLFTPSTCLALNESKRVMVVETIEDNTDSEGRRVLTVSGRSLEKLLLDRTARNDNSNTELVPEWQLTGRPDLVATIMVERICFYGGLNPADIIPLFQIGSAYPAENIPLVTNSIEWSQAPDNLFNAVKAICDAYEMGFRLYRNNDLGNLYFDVYTGNNRTTLQRLLDPVIFTPGLETVQSTTRLMTIEQDKNVAYVFNEQGFVMVYAKPNDPIPTGVNRRVLTFNPPKLVLKDEDGKPLKDPDGEEILPTPSEINDYLTDQGIMELAKYRSMLAFDGEITQRSPYRYGVHYDLGDLVEMRDDDGMGNNMRVTEQIFVSDSEGDRAYPTLTINSFIVPGAWDSWLGNRQWADFGATEYWNTQP